MDSGSAPVRIQRFQCKREANLYSYWYGSIRIRSSVNGPLGKGGFNLRKWNSNDKEVLREIRLIEALNNNEGKPMFAEKVESHGARIGEIIRNLDFILRNQYYNTYIDFIIRK